MYRYILTRYCLQSGTVTLRPGAERTLEVAGETTLGDGHREYRVRVLPGRIEGLEDFFRDAGLSANDVLLLSAAGEGRLHAEYRHSPRRAAPTPPPPPASPRPAPVGEELSAHVVARRSGSHSAALEAVLGTVCARSGLQLGRPGPGLWRLYAPLGERAYDVVIAEDAQAAQAPEFRVAAYPLRLLGEGQDLSRPEDAGQRGVALGALQDLAELLRGGRVSLLQLEPLFAGPAHLTGAGVSALLQGPALQERRLLEGALLQLAPLPAGSLVSASALPGEGEAQRALILTLTGAPLSLLDDLGGGELYLRQEVAAALGAAQAHLQDLRSRLPARRAVPAGSDR